MFHDDTDPEFSDAYLDGVLAEVKQTVKRRRGMTALPTVVAITFGIATYFILVQPSSPPVATISTDVSSGLADAADEALEATSASSPSVAGIGSTSYEPDSSPAAAAAAADDGSSSSRDASASQASFRSRVAIGFDNTTLTETTTDLGPTSPPPESADDEVVEWFESPWQRLLQADPDALVGNASRVDASVDPSRLPAHESKVAAASESVDSDTPSVGQADSEAGEKAFPDGDGSQPVTIRIAPSSKVDELSVTLTLAVNDPDGSTVGACGSYIDWNDGTVTHLDGPCDASCDASAGFGTSDTVTFRHTFDAPGDVEATAVIFTGKECYGDGATQTFSFSVPPKAAR